MQYMEAALEKRLDPARLVPGARSVICVADRYSDKQNNPGITDTAPPPANAAAPVGKIARYAWGDDYHRVMKKRLHRLADDLREVWPDETYRTTVDTAPILEREQASRAGMGWVGKNTMLIHPKLGSYFLLGEIVTTLAIETAEDVGGSVTDHCGTCTRCIEACPTQCIAPEGYALDASRCVSYLTLEHRATIEPTLHAMMGDWLAGCDVCQEVCPFNQERPTAGTTPARRDESAPSPEILPAYRARPPAPGVDVMSLLSWDADARQQAFERSALKRVKLEQLKRNALIIAGNHLMKHNAPALRERVRAIGADAGESELVRLTAEQVLNRIHDARYTAE